MKAQDQHGRAGLKPAPTRPIATAAILLVCLLAVPAHAERADVGRPAPTFEAATLAGQPLALADLKGRVVLIDFWASWCDPCREEFPELDALYREFREQGVEVIGVSVDLKRDNIDAFISKHPVAFPIIHDPKKAIADRFKPRAMPTAYLVDRAGVVRYVHLGYQRAYLEKYREEIRLLLREGAPS